MAKLNGPLNVTSSIGNLTFYKTRTSAQTIVKEGTRKKESRVRRHLVTAFASLVVANCRVL